MFCNVCQKYEKHGIFISGSTNFKLESIKHHHESASHKSNVQKEKALTARPGTSVAEKTIETLNKSNYLRLTKLFKNAHAVAKHARPYTDYTWLCKLDEAKGVDVGNTYRNNKQAVNFIHYIAEAKRKDISAQFQLSKFMSPISDGSTDSSSSEAEIVYIRHCHRGIVKTNFIGVKNIPKADADGIYTAIRSLLTDSLGETWKTKVVGVGTDGASVMLGKTNGVVARLKNEVQRPFIQAIHCSAHRLELAYKDATKPIEIFKKVDNLLLAIYLFYKNSPLNRANLKASFSTLGQKPLIPSRVGGTRWLPHINRAFENLLTGYSAILQHLTQV